LSGLEKKAPLALKGKGKKDARPNQRTNRS
jgi:hypothetical protein